MGKHCVMTHDLAGAGKGASLRRFGKITFEWTHEKWFFARFLCRDCVISICK